MARRDIIVIGASAGGVEALSDLVRALPASLPAAVFVVCHFPPLSRSALPEILSSRGPLLAAHPRDGEPIYPGHIYIAPPDRHLVVEPGTARLTRGPRENRFRPSIDVLFRSAARAYANRVVAVLLSGALSDGLAGLLAVQSAGGLVALQSPDDALQSDLPQSALAIAGADLVAPAGEIGAQLLRLLDAPIAPPSRDRSMDPIERIAETVNVDKHAQAAGARGGSLSLFSCPECGGSLWQLDEDRLVSFRCHVGHVYLAEALLAEQAEALEAALWTAVRTFREREVLSRQLAARARAAGEIDRADRFDEEARSADRNASLIQQHLLQGGTPPDPASLKRGPGS